MPLAIQTMPIFTEYIRIAYISWKSLFCISVDIGDATAGTPAVIEG